MSVERARKRAHISSLPADGGARRRAGTDSAFGTRLAPSFEDTHSPSFCNRIVPECGAGGTSIVWPSSCSRRRRWGRVGTPYAPFQVVTSCHSLVPCQRHGLLAAAGRTHPPTEAPAQHKRTGEHEREHGKTAACNAFRCGLNNEVGRKVIVRRRKQKERNQDDAFPRLLSVVHRVMLREVDARSIGRRTQSRARAEPTLGKTRRRVHTHRPVRTRSSTTLSSRSCEPLCFSSQ